MDPLTAGVELAQTVITRIWPDKSQAEAAQLAAQVAIVQGQLDTNKAEAASPSAFTSGWRPAIGWVCALALACQYIARPLGGEYNICWRLRNHCCNFVSKFLY